MRIQKFFVSAVLSLFLFSKPILAMDWDRTSSLNLGSPLLSIAKEEIKWGCCTERRLFKLKVILTILSIAGASYGVYELFDNVIIPWLKNDDSGDTDNIPKINIEMISLPAGSFEMGSNSTEANDDEKPVHTVTLDAFSISKYPITYGVWTKAREWGLKNGYTDLNEGQAGAYAPQGRNTPSNEKKGVTTNDKYFHPVVKLTWYDIAKFCNLLSEMLGLTPAYTISTGVYRTGNEDNISINFNANGFKIPTEAQAEYSQRGGFEQETYPWGENINKTLSNYDYLYNGTLAVNGTYQNLTENDYNISQTVGNVYIWCWDWWDENFYSNGQRNNPTGPTTGVYRSVRSCSWASPVYHCTSSHRTGCQPSVEDYSTGFRISSKI